MVLMGYLAFLDPPKESAAQAVAALRDYGVRVKVLTGDNDAVTRSICRQVGLPAERVLLGADLADMDDERLRQEVERVDIFAKLSPQQKARIVACLRGNGHVTGFMGDGINDAAAMRTADVGISVDTAVDVARESAGVILLEKDLTVLEAGVIEGRRTYANIIKYIKMTVSSNFGNMFSVLAASVFLPFLPMTPLQILVLNLIYDLSCTTIPWDNVDEEETLSPRDWSGRTLGRFMLSFGPISSVFDIATFLFLYYVLCPALCGGVTYILFDPVCYFLFYNFIVAHRYVDLGFVVVSPHIAAMILVFPFTFFVGLLAQPLRGVPPVADRGRDAASALPAFGGGVGAADLCGAEVLRGSLRRVAHAGEDGHDAADDGLQFPRSQIFHLPPRGKTGIDKNLNSIHSRTTFRVVGSGLSGRFCRMPDYEL